jgi:hypothetical protein
MNNIQDEALAPESPESSIGGSLVSIIAAFVVGVAGADVTVACGVSLGAGSVAGSSVGVFVGSRGASVGVAFVETETVVTSASSTVGSIVAVGVGRGVQTGLGVGSQVGPGVGVAPSSAGGSTTGILPV